MPSLADRAVMALPRGVAAATASIPFRKLHGLGNDYIFVRREEVEGWPLPLLARALSDRHFGIGSDGLIVAGPPPAGGVADLSMAMFNADGSAAEMCGNGVRGLVRFAIEAGLVEGPVVRVASGGAVVASRLRSPEHPAGGEVEVEVDMGPPRLAAALVPVRLDGLDPAAECLGEPIARLAAAVGGLDLGAIVGEDARFSAVSMGNPHLVVECGSPEAVPLERVGPRLERAACFPEGVNVHFAKAIAVDRIAMRTWERGSGATMACGSGACAVFAALRLRGRVGEAAQVDLPGGSLHIAQPQHRGGIRMRGEAVAVFEGRVDPWPILRRLGLAEELVAEHAAPSLETMRAPAP
jgi:diaminopimelate epimerase